MASLGSHEAKEPHRRIWRSWTLATATGELLGFAVPTLVGATAFALLGEPEGLGARLGFYLLLVAAGAGEGAVLGLAQAAVLRRALPRFPAHDWVVATALAAALAWSIGLLPSTLSDDPTRLPLAVIAIAGPALALILLNTIGAAQWLVLRRLVARAGWWIPANAVAWVLGLLPTFVIPALLPDTSPPPLWIVAGIIAGVLMGTIVGLITGRALTWLLGGPRLVRPGPLRQTEGRQSSVPTRGTRGVHHGRAV